MLKFVFLVVRMPLFPLISSKTPQWTTLILVLSLSLLLIILLRYQPTLIPIIDNIFLLDSINSPLIILSLWITMIIIISRFYIIHTINKEKIFITLIIIILIILITAFLLNNIFLFYIIFETSLIPITLIILTWGYQPERIQARFYLILYTILASLPLLLSTIFIFKHSGNLSFFNKWSCPIFSPNIRKIIWLILVIAFLVKIPIFLTHLWLPKAHVEAPVAGSIILAGILLKLGRYGLIRISSILPQLNYLLKNPITRIRISGAIITSLICLRQTDLKSLIAYSSVGHIGILTAGIISNSSLGWNGAILIIIAHGLSSSSLFAIRYITYETTKTRRIFLTKGLSTLFPHITIIWFFAVAANIAAPPSLNLIREIILFSRTLFLSQWTWIIISLSRFLTVAYSLFIYTATQHGPIPQFYNPIHIYSQKNIKIRLLHIIPLITTILKPEIIFLY